MFETQRIVNSYPLETSIRDDSSSFGFRFYSVMGDYFQQYKKDLRRLAINYYPKTALTDYISSLYIWDTTDFAFTFTNSLGSKLRIPQVTGDGTELTNCKFIEDLIFGLPKSIEFVASYSGTHIVYESTVDSSSAINDINFPGHLYIELENVESFIVSSDSSKLLAPNYKATLYLVGEDTYGNSITEYLFPVINGVYITTNIYAKLLDFTLTNIGNNGTIRIKSLDFNLQEYISPYITAVTNTVESLLIKDFDSDFFYLRYYLFPAESGVRINADQETIAAISLLDSESNVLSIRDITFCPNTEDLYCLSDSLYVYRNWLSALQFNEPQVDRTLETPIVCEFLYRYIGLEQTNTCYVGPSTISQRIKNYNIKFYDPNGNIFYLNSDYELSEDSWSFTGVNSEWAGDSISNFSFDFSLDVLGQWDIVIESTDFNDVVYVYTTSILVPFLTPSQEIQLDEDYLYVSFHESGKIYLANESEIDEYNPIYSLFYIEEESKITYTSENYTDLELVYV